MKIVKWVRFSALLLAMALGFSTVTSAAQEEVAFQNYNEKKAEVSGQTITMPMKWTQHLGFDGTSPGAFDFTDVENPSVCVIITAFTPLEPETQNLTIHEGYGEDLSLPDSLCAEIKFQWLAVPVTWDCVDFDVYTPGTYIFSAVFPETYSVAANVTVPIITVKVTQQMTSVLNAAGTGTELDPFIITSGEQLAVFAAIANNGEYMGDVWAPAASLTLINDIDLTGYGDEWGWIPIGSESHPFSGNFDGGNHNITGLFINRPNANYQGLFGCITSGTAKNISISGGSVTGNWFAGSLSGHIENSNIEKVTASIGVAGKWYVGGIAGITVNSIIKDCSAAYRLTGDGYVGGIAGYVDEGVIESSKSTGDVTGRWCVGGLAGVVIAGNVLNGHVSGNVTGDWYVGGITGYMSANSTIQNDADMNVMVSGIEYADRFAGYVEHPTD